MGWKGQWKDGIPPGALPASLGSGHRCRCGGVLTRLTYGYRGDYQVDWGCSSGCGAKGHGRGRSVAAASRIALRKIREAA